MTNLKLFSQTREKLAHNLLKIAKDLPLVEELIK
jgi:hypothetical protein